MWWSYLTADNEHCTSIHLSNGDPCLVILPVFIFPDDSLVDGANPQELTGFHGIENVVISPISDDISIAENMSIPVILRSNFTS